ncbi:MAG: hypothetical protein ACRDX8_10805 [Acidimicrobiales bacterium]
MSNDRLASVRAELVGALEALDELMGLAAEGEEAFLSSADRRERFRYLWIVAGSRLKNYCQVIGVSRAVGELGQAIGFRHVLAYTSVRDVDDGIVWRTSLNDLPRLREAVSATERALGQDPGLPPSSSV